MDAWFKFDGIPGSSTSKLHKDEIEVLAWNWGIDAPQSSSAGSGASRGRATAREFTFVHVYDKASPLVAKAAASGQHIASGTLSVAKSGGEQIKDFLTFKFKDLLITSVDVSGDEDEVLEEVSFASRSVQVDHTEQDSKGGLGETTSFLWDLTKHKFS